MTASASMNIRRIACLIAVLIGCASYTACIIGPKHDEPAVTGAVPTSDTGSTRDAGAIADGFSDSPPPSDSGSDGENDDTGSPHDADANEADGNDADGNDADAGGG